MKKKLVIVSIILLLLISTAIVITINKNNKKYVFSNGVMLAMTLTDINGNTKNILDFPNDKSYQVDVDCGENARGRWFGKEWKLVLENIKGNVACNVNFYERKDSDKLNNVVKNAGVCSDANYFSKDKCESNDGTWTVTINNINGYRYSGEDPNNYVWFNNELWRIIGLIPTCIKASDGVCSERIELVKIIRNESIGAFPTESVSWEESLMYSLLNNSYYGRQNVTGTDSCYGVGSSKSKCDYSNIGISNSNTDYYNQMLKSVYWNIGNISINDLPDAIYENEIATVTNSVSNIGLVSVSDYGYAPQLSDYNYAVSYYNNRVTTETNWLYSKGSLRTYFSWINSSNTFYLYVDVSGAVANSQSSIPSLVRPVVHLSEDIYVISGKGTYSDPYMIGF